MKKIISFILVLTVLLSPNLHFSGQNKALAQEEEAAQGVVSAVLCLYDFSSAASSAVASLLSVPTNSAISNAQQGGANQKDCIMDSIGFVLKELLIKEITASTVRWINGGFEGKPQYVQDLGGFLEDTADAAIGEVIYNDENWNFLCGGIKPEVRLASALNIYASSERSRPRCTLSEVADNVGDLSVKWDWDNFNELTSNPANSALGGYIYASGNIVRAVENVTGRELGDINRSNGFLSHKKCEEVPNYSEEGPQQPRVECRIVTPGSVIEDRINSSIGSDQRRIELADEFNEVFAALVGQLIKKVLGDDGLESVSQSGTGQDGASFLDDYESEVSEETLRQILEQAIQVYESYNTKLDDYEDALQANAAAQALVIDAGVEGFICYNDKAKEIRELDPLVYQPWLLSTQDLSKLTLDLAGEKGERLRFLVHEDLLLNGLKRGRQPPSAGGHQGGYDDANYLGRTSPDYNSPDRVNGPTEDRLVFGEPGSNVFEPEGGETYWSGAPLYGLDDIRNWGINALRHRSNKKIEELKNFDFSGKDNEAGLNELLALAGSGLDPELALIPVEELDAIIAEVRRRESTRRKNLPETERLRDECKLYTEKEEIASPVVCDPSVYQCAGSDSGSSSDNSGSGQDGSSSSSSEDNGSTTPPPGPVGGTVD